MPLGQEVRTYLSLPYRTGKNVWKEVHFPVSVWFLSLCMCAILISNNLNCGTILGYTHSFIFIGPGVITLVVMVRMPVLVLINEAWIAFCGEIINGVCVCVECICISVWDQVHMQTWGGGRVSSSSARYLVPWVRSYLREAFTWLAGHRAPRNSLTWPPNAEITVAMPVFLDTI